MSSARAIAALVVVPTTFAVAGTILIDARSGNIGMAAVPFILAGYAVGIGLVSLLRFVLPLSWCFYITVIASVLCALWAMQGSNLAAWLLVPALGGLFLALPNVFLPPILRAPAS